MQWTIVHCIVHCIAADDHWRTEWWKWCDVCDWQHHIHGVDAVITFYQPKILYVATICPTWWNGSTEDTCLLRINLEEINICKTDVNITKHWGIWRPAIKILNSYDSGLNDILMLVSFITKSRIWRKWVFGEICVLILCKMTRKPTWKSRYWL